MPFLQTSGDGLRRVFFRHFFHLLLIASSVGMWAVPMWVLAILGGVSVPIVGHLVAVAAIYGLNRRLVQGRRRSGGNWLRRYTAVAFVLLLCALFLLASSSFFAVVGALAAIADPDAGRFVAGAYHWWGMSGIAILTAAMAFGYTGGQRQLRVSRVEVPLPDWSGRWRLLQLSDIHVGQNLSVDQLESFVALANREAPDLICLTGDIADGPQADTARFFPILARLQAPLGVVAVLGNHDHYAGADRVHAALEAQGIRVLRDDAMTVEQGGQRLHVIGLDDRGLDWARGMPDDPILHRLLRQAPPGVPQLLLVHRPDVFRQASGEGVALTLSGHTHGGQLAVPWFDGRRRNFAEFVTKFDRGLFSAGRSRLYVNCGLGVTGQRIRLFTPREISVFDLSADAAAAFRADGGGTPVTHSRPGV